MHAAESLRDIHLRTHICFSRLLDHCRTLSVEELARPLPGFGFPTVQRQLHHMVGAQRYWLSVICPPIDARDDEADFPTIDELDRFRASVSDSVVAYLARTTRDDLNRRAPHTTFDGHSYDLVPAHMLLRTDTHIHRHLGQVVAMCAILGRPAPAGLDLPVRD